MADIVESREVSALLEELTTLVGREDPYGHYARLREIGAFVRADDGTLIVTRFAECAAVARDHKLGKMPVEMLAHAGLADWADHPALYGYFTSLLGINPPDHTRLRRLVSSSFTARRVQALRPATERMIDGLIDEMDGTVDFVAAFAFPLPCNVISELLGIPPADRAQFQHLVSDWSAVLDDITPEVLSKANPAARAVRDYLAGLAAERRRRPREDLMSALVGHEEAGDRLTEDELLTMAGLLFAAGFETTTNLLSNGLVALLAHPEQLPCLFADPASAVQELLRYDSPVQNIDRTALETTTVAGVTFQPGDRIVAYTGSANRDARRFPDPDRLDLRRGDNTSLSFGGGMHYCLGAPMAKLEAEIAFPRLFERLPNLKRAEGAQRRDSLTIRGFDTLPVTTG
ncbi:cytochrome P450 [Paractinoplanes brasiliensis]|uniref:cytochrome P450 n=1 Tax=Paractinoplanes brasiliensis TaxID=52695 RepID=UPI0010613595|nr:cytochrome P450 [Actinoplanes brasiliensis]GID28501.1 cytochrome P450 [Actinoplanes brasiliensis]